MIHFASWLGSRRRFTCDGHLFVRIVRFRIPASLSSASRLSIS